MTTEHKIALVAKGRIDLLEAYRDAEKFFIPSTSDSLPVVTESDVDAFKSLMNEINNILEINKAH